MAEGGGWLSKYGIPSILASIVVFAFQQQQQTFDRLQANVQSGYQFYSSNRTQLSSSEDADRELALLKIVGRAFPNIYCDLRDDLYQRVLAAQNADTVKSGGIDSADLELLRSSIMAHELDHPKVLPLPTNVIEALTPHFGPQTAKACPGLNVPTPVVAQAQPTAPAPQAAPSATTATADAAQTTQTQSAGLSGVRSEVAAAARAPARGLAVAAANQPALSSSAATMRVFFHVSAGGHRDTPDALAWSNRARMGLAPYNYRVVRGIERVNPGDVPDHPEIRYFGPNEAPAAEQLAVYLNWQFRDEGLQFRLNAIGDRYPNMPHENLEVWLPEPRS
ncbi:MAG TPA: hypothetical protein VG841_13695 [Caulobacterales bacterium]|nr:hypothetical protein [Caulobacterales bacterium]